MKVDEIVKEFAKRGIDLGEHGQVRKTFNFSDKTEGFSSPLVLFVGISMGHLSVSLGCNSLMIVEPFKRKVDTIDNVSQAVEECIEFANKLNNQAQELVKIC